MRKHQPTIPEMHIYYTTLQTMQFNHPVCETRRILIFINYSQDKDIRMKMTKIYIHVRRQWKIKTLSKIQNICNSFIFLYIYIFFCNFNWHYCTLTTNMYTFNTIRCNYLYSFAYELPDDGLVQPETCWRNSFTYLLYLFTYLLTYSLHAAESFLRN